MVELPDNSYAGRSKPAATPAKAEPERTPVEPIVEGKVMRRKKPLTKRFAHAFFGGETHGVLGYVAMEVLLPAARDLMYEMVSEGFQRMLYGDMARPSRGASPFVRGSTGVRGGFNYNGVSKTTTPAGRPEQAVTPRMRRDHQFDELVFADIGDAQKVLLSLQGYIERYNAATVADLYNLTEITPEFTDEKWGWKDLTGAGVKRFRGAYLLDLPPTQQIE